MSASQVTVIALILAAFALGWWGHGWRQGARSKRADDPGEPAATVPFLSGEAASDAVLRAVLTAFQAALGIWQVQGPSASSPTPLARQALAAFRRERAALAALDLDDAAPPGAAAALQRARRAADRLAEGLAPLAAGEPLERERERALVGAERTLIAARHELIAARRTP
jgi:hypothetical protein